MLTGHSLTIRNPLSTRTEKCQEIAIEISDRGGEGKAYGNLCSSYQAVGDFKKAIDCCEKLVKIALEIGDRRREGGAYGNLGDA